MVSYNRNIVWFLYCLSYISPALLDQLMVEESTKKTTTRVRAHTDPSLKTITGSNSSSASSLTMTRYAHLMLHSDNLTRKMMKAYRYLCREFSVKLWIEDVFQIKLEKDLITEIADGVRLAVDVIHTRRHCCVN